MNNKISYSILLLLILGVLTLAQAQAQGELKLFVSGTDTIRELGLKAVRMGNGQIIPTSNFAISPDSVVQIKQNANLTIFTSTNEPQRIQTVKVISSSGETTELVPPQYSLRNLPIGVYTLNVIVDNPTTSSLNSYETLLIILAPDQPPIQKTEINNIIQKQKVIVEVDFGKDKDKDKPSICYFDPDDKACDPEDGKCPPGFGFNDDDRCIPHGECPKGYTRLDDDETGRCYAEKDTKICDDNSIRHKFQECPEPVIPICDIDTPPGVTCRDEGDPDTCEEGFADYGKGCEPVHKICPAVFPPLPGCGGVEPEEDAEEGETEDTGDSLGESDNNDNDNEDDGGNDDGGSSDENGGSDNDEEESSNEGNPYFG
jgi:hypothetical protein